jgi:hypothetical protein
LLAVVSGSGANGNIRVVLTVRHGGIVGRVLRGTGKLPRPVSNEDEIASEVSFLLSDLDRDFIVLVEKLCAPLFLLFNFQRFGRDTYQEIVSDFVSGKVT